MSRRRVSAPGTGDGDPTCWRLGSGRGEGTGHCSVRGPLCRARGAGGAWGGAWLPGPWAAGCRRGRRESPERSGLCPGEADSGGVGRVPLRLTGASWVRRGRVCPGAGRGRRAPSAAGPPRGPCREGALQLRVGNWGPGPARAPTAPG